MAQLAGTEANTKCISAEGYNSPNECTGYDSKQSEGTAPVILELWRKRIASSLPSLHGPL